MTPEKQRAAIAMARGWNDMTILDEKYGQTDVPNYTSDLNAMHEAEKKLSYEQLDEYHYQLQRMTVRPYHASAACRAEAFLRALGLWEEETQ